MRQLVITKCDSFIYYKVRQLVITKCDSYFITKCDKCYYKVRQVLQSAMIITKCDRTHAKMNNTSKRVNNAAKKNQTRMTNGRKPVETRTCEHKIKHGNKQIERNTSSCSAEGLERQMVEQLEQVMVLRAVQLAGQLLEQH